jgi:hypothetical protein
LQFYPCLGSGFFAQDARIKTVNSLSEFLFLPSSFFVTRCSVHSNQSMMHGGIARAKRRPVLYRLILSPKSAGRLQVTSAADFFSGLSNLTCPEASAAPARARFLKYQDGRNVRDNCGFIGSDVSEGGRGAMQISIWINIGHGRPATDVDLCLPRASFLASFRFAHFSSLSPCIAA